MPYSITELKADAEAAFHGTSISKVRNFYGAMNRAARRCVADIDFAETKRVIPLVNPIFSQVYDYPAPSDLKGDRIVDIRRQGNHRWYGGWSGWVLDDTFNQTYSSAFNYSAPNVGGVISSIRWNGGVKTLRISTGYQTPSLITNAGDVTGWTAGGTASNLQLDTQNFYEGSSSLRFDLGAGTGWLENSTVTGLDLTNLLNLGSLFNLVYLPATNLTSVTLRWGSSAADYWEVTATYDHASNTFQLGWNTVEFPWPAATTGTPDVEDITYLRVSYVASASMTGVRMDSITASLGRIYECEYYSKNLFRDGTTGAFKEKVTADSDLLNLDTDSYEVYLSCLFWMIAQQLQGLDANVADGPYNEAAYIENTRRYISTHRSEVSPPVVPYYNIEKPRRLTGRVWRG